MLTSRALDRVETSCRASSNVWATSAINALLRARSAEEIEESLEPRFAVAAHPIPQSIRD
jgi:hypothetical protein